MTVAAAPPDRGPEPLGGYWDMGERDPEPPDGHERVYTGSILLPLGALAAVSGGVGAWVTSPARCQSYLGSYGTTEQQCKGLFTFNLIHASFGAALMIAGGVMLGIGLKQRKRHRQWKAKRGLSIAPILDRHSVGVGARLRF